MSECLNCAKIEKLCPRCQEEDKLRFIPNVDDAIEIIKKRNLEIIRLSQAEVERKLEVLKEIEDFHHKWNSMPVKGDYNTNMQRILCAPAPPQTTVGDLKPGEKFCFYTEAAVTIWGTCVWEIPVVSSEINQGESTRFMQNVTTELIVLCDKTTPCAQVKEKEDHFVDINEMIEATQPPARR